MRKLIIILTFLLSLSLTGQVFAAEPTSDPQSNNPAPVQHVVKAGDTLSRIASHYHVTLEHLIKINNITNPNKLKIGQIILISETSNISTQEQRQAAAPDATEEKNKEKNEEKYIVKAGDTLSRIAGAKGITVEAIVKANNI
ncbi:MAG: LysM peptidoglycan-binding domain-containing protein [Bacillota bacterium]|jgi:LysM repeat protein